MEKFEKEYRQMIQEEMPDLWERIEERIEEKIGDRVGDRIEDKNWRKENGRWNRMVSAQRTGLENAAGGKHIRQKKAWRYMGVAAACLGGVILVPAALSLFRAGFSGSGYGNAYSTAPRSADMTASESTAGESTEMGTGMAGGESVTVDMAPMESASEMTAEEKAESETPIAGSIPDRTILPLVKVKVLEITEMQYHAVYLVKVERDGSGWLAEGEEIRFLSGLGSGMETGGEYEVSLVYHEGAEVPFRLLE